MTELLKNEWIILYIGLFFTAIWPIVLYFLKPRLEIQSVEIIDMNGECLAINIVNRGSRAAVNLQIEVCVLEDNNYTYHLEIDKDDFIILPAWKPTGSSHERKFKSYDIASFTKRYFNGTFSALLQTIRENPEILIRIRVHANHSYSGFGKAFEKKFKYLNGFQPIA